MWHDGFLVTYFWLLIYLRIVRCILGVGWLLVACLALVLCGSLLVGRLSGMLTVKVHEWCLVCYGWLAVCSRSNVHACLPLHFSDKACFALSSLWVSCVAYLIDGNVWLYGRPFSSCVAHAAWDEP